MYHLFLLEIRKYHECAVETRKMGAVLNGDSNYKVSITNPKNKTKLLFSLPYDEQKHNTC